MAFASGSSVAYRAVDALLGPHTIQHETVVSEAAAAPAPPTKSMVFDACRTHSKLYVNLTLTCYLFAAVHMRVLKLTCACMI